MKNTILIAILAAITSCATLKADAIVAGKSFAACGEKDASSLFSQVSTIIAENAANLEASLASLTVTVGTDAVKCAIAAIESTIPQGSGSAIATSATAPAHASGLARAQAWAAGAK